MANIYRKTSKGTEEVAARAHGLSQRLRTALILADGRRDEAALRGLIGPNAAETLQELVTQGYLEVAVVAVAARTVEKAGAPAASAPAAAGNAPSFPSFRAAAVRAFNDLAGPAGETLAIKMEKAATREQLAPLLQLAHQIVSSTRGQQAADEFKARFARF